MGRRPARRKSARRPLKQIRADACNLLSGDLLYRAVEAMQRDAERAQPANLEDQKRLKEAAKTIRKLNLEQARIRKLLNRQNPRRQPDGEAKTFGNRFRPTPPNLGVSTESGRIWLRSRSEKF